MICNPHAMNISICNAHNNYFADCKSDGMGKKYIEPIAQIPLLDM